MGVSISIKRTRKAADAKEDSWRQALSDKRGHHQRRNTAKSYPRNSSQLSAFQAPHPQPSSLAQLDALLSDGGYEIPGRQDSDVEEREVHSVRTSSAQKPLRRCKGPCEAERGRLDRLVSARFAKPSAPSRNGSSAPGKGKARARSLFGRLRSDGEVRDRRRDFKHEGCRSRSSKGKPSRPRQSSATRMHKDDAEELEHSQSSRFSLRSCLRRMRCSSNSRSVSEEESSSVCLFPSSTPDASLLFFPRSPHTVASPEHLSTPLTQRRLTQRFSNTPSVMSAFAPISTIVILSADDFEAARENLARPTGTITLPAFTLAPDGRGGLTVDQSPVESILAQSRRSTPMSVAAVSDQHRKAHRILPDVPSLLDLESNTSGLLRPEFFSKVSRIR